MINVDLKNSRRHMTHDESTYSDPESFLPERWLNEDGQLDHSASILDSVVFGFGRRCVDMFESFRMSGS